VQKILGKEIVPIRILNTPGYIETSSGSSSRTIKDGRQPKIHERQPQNGGRRPTKSESKYP
jgi:hypothetical protein